MADDDPEIEWSEANAPATTVDIDPVTNTGEATILISARINGQGSIPNTSEQQLVHVTVNANGNVTATVNHFKIVCQ